jgi:hypothetical protein
MGWAAGFGLVFGGDMQLGVKETYYKKDDKL